MKIPRRLLKLCVRYAASLFICAAAPATHAQHSAISWTSFNMGFAESRGADALMMAAIAQSVVGVTQQANSQIVIGFLADTSFRRTLVDVNGRDGLPRAFMLAQNFPNPFNPITTIRYAVPEIGKVTVTVYNVLGQEVATLLNNVIEPGEYSLTWNAGSLPSGVYFYRMTTAKFTQTKKMAVVR